MSLEKMNQNRGGILNATNTCRSSQSHLPEADCTTLVAIRSLQGCHAGIPTTFLVGIVSCRMKGVGKMLEESVARPTN